MNKIPVFIVRGFLDSGKTTFIMDTIESDGFSDQGSTLVLSCEDGEISYDLELMKKHKTEVVLFDSLEDFTLDALEKLIHDKNPDRVIFEVNEMWDNTKIEFPNTLQVYQSFVLNNFETFPMYYNNMRQKFVDMMRYADLIIFNRVPDREALAPYQTSLKMINKQADYYMMNPDGYIDDAFEQELPFDINQKIITIKGEDFGTWYIDTFDHHEHYDGKMVEFDAYIVFSDKLKKNEFIAGRMAMTCCSNDIQLYGHLCKNDLGVELKDRSYAHIVAKLKYEYSMEYQEEEAVLYATEITPIPDLENPVLDLTK